MKNNVRKAFSIKVWLCEGGCSRVEQRAVPVDNSIVSIEVLIGIVYGDAEPS